MPNGRSIIERVSESFDVLGIKIVNEADKLGRVELPKVPPLSRAVPFRDLRSVAESKFDEVQRRLEVIETSNVIHQYLTFPVSDELGLGLKNAVYGCWILPQEPFLHKSFETVEFGAPVLIGLQYPCLERSAGASPVLREAIG